MLAGLFPRLFGNFKEGGLIHCKFVVAAGPLYTRKSNVSTANYSKLTLVTAGTGLVDLTLAGGARSIAVLDSRHKGQDALIGTTLKVSLYSIVESTGVMRFKISNSAATEAIAAAVNGDELHFTLYVDK